MNNNVSWTVLSSCFCNLCLHEFHILFCFHEIHDLFIRKWLFISVFYSFYWSRLWEIIFMKFFHQNWCIFIIIIYDFHVFHLYSSHLIRSSNHTSWVCHFMSLIESTKYRFFSLSAVTNSSSDTCYFTELYFKNNNKLTWNVECIFISSDKSNSYT